MFKNETPAGSDLAKADAAAVAAKPAAGELRGIALSDLLRLEIGSLHTLLSRITTPTLTTQDVARLDTCDLGAIGGEVVGFFMTRAEREAASSTA